MSRKSAGARLPAAALILIAACAGSPPAPSPSARPGGPASLRIEAVEATLRVATDEAAPLRLELGGLAGEAKGRILRMARGVAGAYKIIDYSPYLRGARASLYYNLRSGTVSSRSIVALQAS